MDRHTMQTQFLEEETRYYLEPLFGEGACIDYILEEKEGNDWIAIDIEEGKGTIRSNHAVGLLIGLYTFLKEAGMVFVRPGRSNEIWPDAPQGTCHLEQMASCKHRGVCIEGADSYENIADFIDWLPKIGMNAFFIQFENPYPFLKRWYTHEFNPYQETEDFSAEMAQEMSDRLDLEMARRGLEHHRVGHGWTGEVLGYSSRYGWESGLVLPEDKKKYAALVGGKRELIDGAPILTSLDFANPEVSDLMCQKICDYARARPDVDCLHVWLSDARNNICECEACQKERVADQYIRILNDLDAALEQEGLNTKICFLLYHELLWAPEKEQLRNPDRFIMMFAPITRTFEKSYKDVDYDHLPPVQPYVRNRIVLPNSLEENIACLKAWQKKFAGDSFVYDYPLGRAHYGDLGYMKISDTIYRDDTFLDHLGVDGCISCQELRAGFPHNFPNYIMGAALWNRHADYDQVRNEYFQALYGPGYPQAMAYLEQISAFTSCDHFNAIGERVNPQLAARYAAAAAIADNALPMIETGILETEGLQKEQWKILDLHRTYVMLLADALQHIASGNQRKAQQIWNEFVNWIRLHENEVQPYLDVYRVIEVAKNYAGFKLER